MKFRRRLKKVHFWLGLLLGVQVLIWMASGVVMSWLDFSVVRSDQTVPAEYAIELEARSYANPGGVIARAPGAQEVRLKQFMGRYVYLMRGAGGDALFDAQTGEQLSPLDETMARTVARMAYVGDGKIDRMEYLTANPKEYRGKTPVWRASFSDKLKTRLYISPDTGEVTARRNSIWGIYDFALRLHLMDYEGGGDFNNPLLRAASATGLLFVLTGAVLVVLRLLPRRRRSRRAVMGPSSETGVGKADA